MDQSLRSSRVRLAFAAAVSSALFLSACSSATTSSSSRSGRESAGKEYFAESEYGVKASPRVSNARSRLPRGGGRDMVGKPYKVRGKWYTPREDKNYAKVGAASWYGDAFHGRLTANGEIYDMTHLTAAHPTMPLPSYARVTNTANGASVLVRVNDRGPFAHNRVIDLSKRAAELLDYKHAGVAKVKVEYVGRAPLHGRDDNYLLASYRPGKTGIGRPRPVDDGLPAGVMIAMNGNTPTTTKRTLFGTFGREPNPTVAAPKAVPLAVGAGTAIAAASTFPASPQAPAFGEVLATDPMLPDFGPLVPERPYDGPTPTMLASATLSYADSRVATAAGAFEEVMTASYGADDVRESWKRMNGTAGESGIGGEFVHAGSFASHAEAARLARQLSAIGAASLRQEPDAVTVELRADGRHSTDELVELAQRAGASDAFLVRE